MHHVWQLNSLKKYRIEKKNINKQINVCDESLTDMLEWWCDVASCLLKHPFCNGVNRVIKTYLKQVQFGGSLDFKGSSTLVYGSPFETQETMNTKNRTKLTETLNTATGLSVFTCILWYEAFSRRAKVTPVQARRASSVWSKDTRHFFRTIDSPPRWHFSFILFVHQLTDSTLIAVSAPVSHWRTFRDSVKRL